MNIFEHDERGPGVAGCSSETPAALTEPAEAAVAVTELPTTDDAEETIFSVLAGRARTRERAHLWITAGIGGIDALALMIARPTLWWVAAACAGVGAYAVWGLADRALAQGNANPGGSWTPRILRGIRGLAVVAGVAGVVAAAIGFIGVALGRSGPPG